MNMRKLMVLMSVVLTISTAVLPVLDVVSGKCGCSAHSAPRPKPSNPR